MPTHSYHYAMGVKYGDKLYTWGYFYKEFGNQLLPTLIPKSSYGNKKIKQLAFGSSSVYLLTTDNSLYVWGLNNSGQLGLGDTENRLTPTLMPTSYYGNKQIKKIMTGDYFAYLLTEDGDVYVWGSNDSYSLGLGLPYNQNVLTPTLLPKSSYGNETIKDIYTTRGNLFILTTSNSLYVCGYNGDMNFGWNISSSSSLVKMPPEKYDNREIDSLIVGMYDSTMYTTDGHIYQWGYNAHRKLFFNGSNNDQITLVTGNYPYDHSIASVNGYTSIFYWNNKLYAFGWTYLGQAGNGTYVTNVHYEEIPFFSDKVVTSVLTTHVSLFAVVNSDTGHKLYSWGGARYHGSGEVPNSSLLGLGHADDQPSPGEVQFPEA